ncbi:hypothetical protein POM88_034424 [Heracleum sosnowskyi]|uniref:F-box domain-containing protein n=1 Tax=Heracleum sosnowskyi TaxID=360622 RepID=A0AAD8HJ82_9APIA|nr:hypothetical protein POM88_034424 [Heracleum sosnowskyi]
MARNETSMADIPNDIQKHMLKLVTINNGASDFVRATASCKQWKEFAEDANILKTVKFGSTHKIDESFWKKNGFLVKCANANNKRASDIIARKKREDNLRRMLQIQKGVLEYRPDLPESIKELRRTDLVFFSYGI